jgi:hypothetical protein
MNTRSAAAICLCITHLAPHCALAQTSQQLAYACKSLIEQSLHDPRDAQLSWTEAVSKKNKQGEWVVQFPGRGANQNGVLRKATFECVIRFTPPDDFRAVKVRAF